MRNALPLTHFATFFLISCLSGSFESWIKTSVLELTSSVRIETTIRTVTVKSDVGCCHECLMNDQCGSVSVHTVNNTCRLHEGHVEDYSAGNITNDVSWNVYSKTCDAGWTRFNHRCYYASTVDIYWQQGRDTCQNLGADLIEIRNEATQSFIVSNFPGNTPIWLGLRDTESEGTFKWVSDESKVTYRSWKAGQPDDYEGGQDCAALNTSTWKWSDELCGAHFRIMCEKHL